MIKTLLLSVVIGAAAMSTSFNANATTSAWQYTCFLANGSVAFAGTNTYAIMLQKKLQCERGLHGTFLAGPTGDIIER